MTSVAGRRAGSRGGGRETAAAALRGLTALLAAAGITAAAAACGGDAGGGEDGGRTAAPAGDTATAASADSAPAADPRPLRAFRFRIRNDAGDTAVIVADAGAGERALDTVPPADSGEVRVETRAPLLELRARSVPAGEALARSRYDLERAAGDTLLEFPVPPGDAPPDSAGG